MKTALWTRFSFSASACFAVPAFAAERPNVIIIFIDDMGYGDVGFNGATGPRTPNLDQVAAEGMRFDHFYVGCAVCSGSWTRLGSVARFVNGSHPSMRICVDPHLAVS